MVRYTLEQHVFLYVSYVKYRSARKRRRNFRDDRVPSRQTILNLVNKLTTTGLLRDKKQKYKRRVLTEKVDGIGIRLDHISSISLKRLVQETGMSKSSAGMTTQLLKLRLNNNCNLRTPCSSAIQLAVFVLQLVFTVCRRR
jgi:hypothetical protein